MFSFNSKTLFISIRLRCCGETVLRRQQVIEREAHTAKSNSGHYSKILFGYSVANFEAQEKLGKNVFSSSTPVSQVCPNVCENSTYAGQACLPCRLCSCLTPILHLHCLLSLLSELPSLPICNNSARLYLTEWLGAVSNQDFGRAASLCHIITSRIYRSTWILHTEKAKHNKTKHVVGVFLPRVTHLCLRGVLQTRGIWSPPNCNHLPL